MRAPILIGEIELTEPVTAIRPPARHDGAAYNGAYLLVRIQHIPVGYVFLPPDAFGAAAVERKVWQELKPAINEGRRSVGLPGLEELPAGGIPEEPLLADQVDLPFVSVVVCTRDRTDSVLDTLRDLAGIHYARFEVVLVDNAPSSDATREAVLREFGADPRIRYVRELRPGLSCARNRGLREATADIVAFTDDDVRVDPRWLSGIARGFRAASNVVCVTGLIAAAELENEAQLYFHLREGWGAGVDRRVYDLAENRDASPLYPYTAGAFGAGANFAVSRRILKEIGGFDEALGAGTPAAGGEDLNMFMRIVLTGHRLVYEPSAIVRHVHRADLAGLSRQMYAYGSGCTAALTAILLDSTKARRELPSKVLVGVGHMRQQSSGVRGNETLPSGLMKREIAGFLAGPGLYLKGRRNLRRMSRKAEQLLNVAK
jgi:GT2 family glycosyltransferase